LDVFPDQAAEAAAWINFFRVVAGFIVNYFQLQWATKTGAAASFGTQGAICFAALLLVILVQIYGRYDFLPYIEDSVSSANKCRRWRERYPPPVMKGH
jgi:hypothetical protein